MYKSALAVAIFILFLSVVACGGNSDDVVVQTNNEPSALPDVAVSPVQDPRATEPQELELQELEPQETEPQELEPQKLEPQESEPEIDEQWRVDHEQTLIKINYRSLPMHIDAIWSDWLVHPLVEMVYDPDFGEFNLWLLRWWRIYELFEETIMPSLERQNDRIDELADFGLTLPNAYWIAHDIYVISHTGMSHALLSMMDVYLAGDYDALLDHFYDFLDVFETALVALDFAAYNFLEMELNWRHEMVLDW
jgi:hypothetical protein